MLTKQENEGLSPTDANNELIFSDVDYLETWKGMEECVEKGLALSIGVSNFNQTQLKRVIDNCNIAPVTNQVSNVVFKCKDNF